MEKLVTCEIVPGNGGKGNGVYQQVLVIVAAQEEGEEQSITIGVPQKMLVPRTDFRRIDGIEDHSRKSIQDKYCTPALNKHSAVNEGASKDDSKL